jgi:hypothetical protein
MYKLKLKRSQISIAAGLLFFLIVASSISKGLALPIKYWTVYKSPWDAENRGWVEEEDKVKTDGNGYAYVPNLVTSWGKVETYHNIFGTPKRIWTIEAKVDARYGGFLCWGKVKLIVWYEYEGGKTTWDSDYESLSTSWTDEFLSVDINGASYTADDDFRYFIRVSKSLLGEVDIDHIEIRIQYSN